ncbi:MAG: DUF4266 domain-containing protein [Cellvibrionaceae bacterium]
MKTFFVVMIVLVASGCTRIEPWVKAHERELLSDPLMSFERDAISTKYINHVYEAREAARGAEGSAGGGCGCN